MSKKELDPPGQGDRSAGQLWGQVWDEAAAWRGAHPAPAVPGAERVEPWVCGGCGAPKKVMRGSPRRGAGAGAALGPAGSLQTQGLAALRQGMRLQPSWKRTVLMQGGPCMSPGAAAPLFAPLPARGAVSPRCFGRGLCRGGWPWHCLRTHGAVSPAWHQHRNVVWGALGCCGEFWGAVGNFGVL